MSEEQLTPHNSCKNKNHALENRSKLDKPKVPTLVINKRPPRKPKVPNTSVMFNEITEQENLCNNSLVESISNSNAIDSNSKSQILQIGLIDNNVIEIGEKIANLNLEIQGQPAEEEIEPPTTSLTSLNENNKKNKKRKRRKRVKKKSNGSEITSIQNVNKDAQISESNKLLENSDDSINLDNSNLNKSNDIIFSGESNLSSDSVCSIDDKNHGKEKRKNRKEKKTFLDHLHPTIAITILSLQDKSNPKAVQGNIRINQRFHQHAYVTMSNNEEDVLIVGLKNRNRALEGDLVVVKINPECKWHRLTKDTLQRTGYVTCILEKVHPRKTVGVLKKRDNLVYLQPRDTRIPCVKIKTRTVPKEFLNGKCDFSNIMVSAIITDWKKIAYAEGEVERIIGSKGDIMCESHAILIENDLNVEPYEDSLLVNLPSSDYVFTNYDLAGREDLRNTCIFTIDPATAVDLDDALSCKMLTNGNYEVGIHIADVTHFLTAFSPLDVKVAQRSTTVYMVDQAYHMLPKQLCNLCSLLPGKDRLAFSVILEINSNAEIVNYRFAKTLINSCCKMSYDQVQIMIENPVYDWDNDESLKIMGNYRPVYLCGVVKNLNNIATKLKDLRFKSGALRIDQPKLLIFLDRQTGCPDSFKLDERKDSNSLVEEFMLLANMIVARQLYSSYPQAALLRSHAEPSKRILNHTCDILKNFGIFLDLESSGSLQSSLAACEPNLQLESRESAIAAQYRMMVINSLCAKSMTRAVYQCTLGKSSQKLKHYALSVDFYTHFTSPIRRYADCIVHRLLYSSINNQLLPQIWTSELCSQLANNCNIKKYAAKVAQEQSTALYFTYFLNLMGPMEAFAIVMEVKERSVDALICDIGLKTRFYFNDTEEECSTEYTLEHSMPTVYLTWTKNNTKQKITIFTILYVKLVKHPALYRLQGIILPLKNSSS